MRGAPAVPEAGSTSAAMMLGMPVRSEDQRTHRPSGLHAGATSTARSSVNCATTRPVAASSTTTSMCAPGVQRDAAIQRASGETEGYAQCTLRSGGTRRAEPAVGQVTRTRPLVPRVSWIAMAQPRPRATEGWETRAPCVTRRMAPSGLRHVEVVVGAVGSDELELREDEGASRIPVEGGDAVGPGAHGAALACRGPARRIWASERPSARAQASVRPSGERRGYSSTRPPLGEPLRLGDGGPCRLHGAQGVHLGRDGLLPRHPLLVQRTAERLAGGGVEAIGHPLPRDGLGEHPHLLVAVLLQEVVEEEGAVGVRQRPAGPDRGVARGLAEVGEARPSISAVRTIMSWYVPWTRPAWEK